MGRQRGVVAIGEVQLSWYELRVLAGITEATLTPMEQASRYLSVIDRETAELAPDYPASAKLAVAQQLYRAIVDLLNAIEESGATELDSRFDRRIYTARTQLNQRFNPYQSTPEEVDEFLATERANHRKYGFYQRYVDKAKEILQAAERTVETERTIGRVTLINRAADPNVLGWIESVVKPAAAAIRRSGWSKIVYGDVIVVRPDQLRARVDPAHAAAAFFWPSDEMWVAYPPEFGLSTENMIRRVIHEWGHRLWYKYLTSAQQRLWEESWEAIRSSSHRFVSRYAETGGYKEDFAECFAALCLGRLPKVHRVRLQEVGV